MERKKLMKRLADWLRESHRGLHLLGGALIGLCADSHYGAAYAAVLTAAALEFKDRAWGGRWDWTDFALTVAGAAAGRTLFCAAAFYL